jgi:hypothetical protein
VSTYIAADFAGWGCAGQKTHTEKGKKGRVILPRSSLVFAAAAASNPRVFRRRTGNPPSKKRMKGKTKEVGHRRTTSVPGASTTQ